MGRKRGGSREMEQDKQVEITGFVTLPFSVTIYQSDLEGTTASDWCDDNIDRLLEDGKRIR